LKLVAATICRYSGSGSVHSWRAPSGDSAISRKWLIAPSLPPAIAIFMRQSSRYPGSTRRTASSRAA